ncbi:glyoxalase [Geobacillus subterraneus]|uniref:Glyoxalase n=2 Tax=Geobacillus TaxID=129337 RepID=A0ABM6AEL5_9BACL|nr:MULTISPECIES: VOC family protein [Geobacillus]AMX84791.1 glyoxalase [Geobacillus subterraneus]KZS25404.1 glyoxalase [Geobacillus subterraneus]OXB85616.1 glyoxalase [Geobacillus uzenensis]QIZ66381.1 VOC family protein [Geobacillus subterraneus]WPZ18588.1 VOC family protein [Geobacillus subterraneus]
MNFHRKPATFVSQVNMKVENIERSIVFYEQVIGFQVLGRTDRTASLTADGQTVLLFIEQPENVIPKRGRTTGLYHFAILLPTRADLGRVLNHLLRIGYPLQGGADHWVSEAIYLADPDGNGIELYVDRPFSTWRWEKGEVAMSTEPLDVDRLIAAGKGEVWHGLPKETLIGHIHLHVSELKRAEQFYTEGLGFDVVNRYGRQALFLSTGKYHHHIGLNTWNGVGAPMSPANSVGLDSFTLMLPDEETKEKVAVQLMKIGASVVEENGSLVTADPSGNRIVLRVSP